MSNTPSKEDSRVRRLMNAADSDRKDIEGFWTSMPGVITAVVVIAATVIVIVLQNIL